MGIPSTIADRLRPYSQTYAGTALDVSRLANLAVEIEALAVSPPLFGNTARTPRGTHFVSIVNGAEKPPGETRAPLASLAEMCNATLAECTRLRAVIDGPAMLVWRDGPTYEPDEGLYLRLCFEPL